MILSLLNTWLIMKVTATTLPTPEVTRGVGTSLYDSYISSVTSVNLKKAGMASRNIVMFKKQYTLFWTSFAVVFGLLVLGKKVYSIDRSILLVLNMFVFFFHSKNLQTLQMTHWRLANVVPVHLSTFFFNSLTILPIQASYKLWSVFASEKMHIRNSILTVFWLRWRFETSARQGEEECCSSGR